MDPNLPRADAVLPSDRALDLTSGSLRESGLALVVVTALAAGADRLAAEQALAARANRLALEEALTAGAGQMIFEEVLAEGVDRKSGRKR